MLCEGEYQAGHGNSKCQPTQAYMYCYEDSQSHAKDLCVQEGSTGTPIVVQLNSVGGNMCGYTFYQITCQ